MRAFYNQICNNINLGALKISSEFWTSGTNAGAGCDTQNIYSWCANGTQMMPDLVKNGSFWISKKWPQTYGSDERCLALNFVSTDAGVRHKGCNSGLPLICEVDMH
jgi:hypothetical protein